MADTLNSSIIEKIFIISRLMREQMKCDTNVAHVSLVQLQVLFFIAKKGKAQMKDIASAFDIEMPTATSVLNKLVSMNLVARKADTKDRRVVRISLTKKGVDLLEKAESQRTAKVDYMLSYLSSADKEEFLRILTSVVTRMEEASEK